MFAAIAISRTTFMSCGAMTSLTGTRAAHREDELVAREVGADAGHRTERDGAERRRHPAGGAAEHHVPDGEAEQSEQDDDEQRHQERVPPVGGDLLVEGVPGHGPFRGRAISSG